MFSDCKSIGCNNHAILHTDFCEACEQQRRVQQTNRHESTSSLADTYPDYYKSVEEIDEIDVYAVHQLFNIQDPSGAIQHSSRKLLLSGVNTKSRYQDIKEARDSLSRWLQLNQRAEI